VHAAAVAHAYHVGSFDDDANYLMAAHVLAAGGGLTTTMPSGTAVVANYLPGYPVLLVPLVWAFGAALWPPRALSLLCVAALYPLVWAWLGGRGVKPGLRCAVLGVLAMNFVVATYATMVMAEAPFLVVLLLGLLALDRWERQPGWRWATVEVALLAELVWLKEAAAGLVAGLVLYELWRRHWLRAAGVSLGVGLLVAPGLAARWATGVATVGARYASEINNPGQGGFLRQLRSEVPQDLWSYLQNVLRQSVLPTGGQMAPSNGPVHVVVTVVGVTVPVFTFVGAAWWYRRQARPEVWMVVAYFVETLGYPDINQRRVVLVVPLVTLWYVAGACVAGRYAVSLHGRAFSRLARSAALLVGVLVAGVPTASGFTEDYMYDAGVQGSEFASSPAMALLKALGAPDSVVETDFKGSVAYFTGHRTAWTAFVATTPYGPFASSNVGSCTMATVRADLRSDSARFLVVGDFSTPGLIDSPCLLQMASSARTARGIGAVRLLSTEHDNTSVFELLGPGTAQPGLVDWTAGTGPGPSTKPVALAGNGQGDAGGTGYRAASVGDVCQFEWAWPRGVRLAQVSVGLLTSSRTMTAASVEIELPGGKWRTLSRSPGPVGDGGRAPYLLATLPTATTAVALRVSARASGAAEVAYVNAIGPP
jgi:hypothetical protein